MNIYYIYVGSIHAWSEITTTYLHKNTIRPSTAINASVITIYKIVARI